MARKSGGRCGRSPVPVAAGSGTRVPRRARHAAVEATIESDEVEKIAMLAGGGVGPFAGRALTGIRSSQTDEETAARCVPYVADEPVAAFAPAVREIIPANRLGIAREMVRQFGGLR